MSAATICWRRGSNGLATPGSQSVDESTLAWHQKPKMLDGAGTTLLWVEIATDAVADGIARPYQLRAYSIGDCCLFHVRHGRMLQTFPIQESTRFEDNPRGDPQRLQTRRRVEFEAMETQCRPGDLLVLCTDAVAGWTMRQLEAGATLDWNAYWDMPLEQWQQWLIELRQQNQIRYDDSTAVLLWLGGEVPTIRLWKRQQEDRLLDTAEAKLRDAIGSLKGSLRKGLRDCRKANG